MKNLLYISFLTMLFLGCQNSKNSDFSDENIITDMVAQRTDTLIKISEPFKINSIECYWTYSIITDGERLMNLKEYKTDSVLLDYSGYRQYEDYKSEDYFDEFNKENFIDVNFDGFKDFVFQNIGNTPMNNSVGIHLFDNKTKTFEEAPDDYLFAQYIIGIDSVNKRFITGNEFRHRTDSTVHHFNKYGKIKFTEKFSENLGWQNDTITVIHQFYEKIINGEIVETKRDSVVHTYPNPKSEK